MQNTRDRTKQSLLSCNMAQSELSSALTEKCCRQVSVAGVGENYYDVLAGIFLCEDLSGLQRCAGRDSYEDTLGYCEPSALLECIFILDGNDLLIDACIERIRYEACADALDLVRTCSSL